MWIFISLIFAFNAPYLILVLLYPDLFSYLRSDIYDASFIFLLFFTLLIVGYHLFFEDKLTARQRNRKSIAISDYNFLLIFTSILLYVLVIISNFSKFLLVLNNGYLGIYVDETGFVNMATLLPFYLFIGFRHSVMILKKVYIPYFPILYNALFVLSVFSFLLTGSRSFVVYFSLSLLFLLKSQNPMKRIVSIKMASLILIIIILIGILREGGFQFDFISLLIRPIVETHHTSKTLIDIVNNKSLIPVDLSRYLYGIGYFFPSSLMALMGIDLPTLFSQEYVRAIDSGWADAGGGFGFSIISELYLSFGYFGIILFPFLLVNIFNFINKLLINENINYTAYALSLCYYIFSLVRSEFIDIYRGLFVITLIFFLARLKIKLI